MVILLSGLGRIRGGLETTATRLARGLAARGHQVTLVGSGPSLDSTSARRLRVPSVPVTLTAWRPLSKRRPGLPLKIQSLSFVAACSLDPRVRRLVTRADVTVTALEVETVLFSEWRARRGKPNVSIFPGGIDRGWLRRDRSDIRLALSETVAAAARSLGHEIHDVIHLPGPPASWLTEPYTVRKDVRTLVFVGRLEANKGVHELLDLLEGLGPRVPELRLRLIGDGPERPAIEQRLADSSLAGRVQLVGAVPPERVLDELRAADLFVFPSRYESWGLAIIEAMALGVPVVASELPAIREAVGTAACLVPVDEPAAWVAATERLIGDAAARRRLSQAGRVRASLLTEERAVDAIEHWLYRSLER